MEFPEVTSRKGLSALTAAALLLVAGLILVPRSRHAPAEAQDKPKADRFKTEIQPILAKHCTACHGAKKQKAKLNLESFTDEASVLKSRKTWKKIWDMVLAREMPPEEKPPLPPAELTRLADWIEATLEKIDPNAPRDPGRVVMRRLNRVEYRNTVRDLLGVDFNPAEDFPSDDVGYGFDNIGDVLSLPPLLMEKYLSAAERILDKAVFIPEKTKPKSRRYEAENMHVSSGGAPESDLLIMFANGEASQQVKVELEGSYLIRVRAGQDAAGNEAAKMSLRIDEKQVKIIDVPASRRDPKIYEEKVALGKGLRKISAAFINDYYNPEAPKVRERDRNLVLDYVEIVGPVDLKPPDPPESHVRLFVTKPGTSVTQRQAAEEILARFLLLAFRRPPAEGEVAKFAALFDFADKQGDSFESAMKLPLQAVLVSPHFLFRIERDGAGKGVQPVDDYALAARLSYFLWSTMPDAALFDLAAQKKLRDPAVYEAQVKRMLRDPRARSLAGNFAIQWLQLRRLETHAPDPKRFPVWNEKLRAAMHEEAVLLFDEIVREDRSVLELLQADYTYLNERLAKHYGIPGVTGEEMRRVALTDKRRGGILTMGAVLTVTSNPTRTAAVKRGKWVLETILGTPPPPPLPDAGELKDETEEDRKLSLRQRLEKHRADPSCAACHRRMDPLGFGFENYDPIGAWREKDGRHPIETAAVLPDGSAFKGPVELKALLASKKDDFVRCLTEKMLTYALGRGVEYYDAAAVKGIRKSLADNGYRVSTLVMEIAKSYPFRHRRDRTAGDEVKND